MKTALTSLLLALCLTHAIFGEGDESGYSPVSLTLGTNPGFDRTLALYGFIGAGFPIGGADVPVHNSRSEVRDGQGTIIEVRDEYLNYGYGMKFEAGIDYMLMENLGLQAGLNFAGSVPRLRITYSEPGDEWTETYHRLIFGLKAAVRPEFQVLELLDMYTTFGVGLFFSTVSIENDDENYADEGYIKTKPAFSFHGSIGAEWPVTEFFGVIGEVYAEQMSFKTKERKSTSAYENAVKSEKNSEVVSSNMIEPPTKIPGTNWGIKVGARYWIF